MTAIQPTEILCHMLRRMGGKSYGYCSDIRGRYRFDTFLFCIEHVRKDPFASPSRVRVLVDPEAAGSTSICWTDSNASRLYGGRSITITRMRPTTSTSKNLTGAMGTPNART